MAALMDKGNCAAPREGALSVTKRLQKELMTLMTEVSRPPARWKTRLASEGCGGPAAARSAGRRFVTARP